jgi:type I restriction enzyme R subunit
MEHLAAFSKLLANRLDGVPAENVGLRGITLTADDIKAREPVGGGDGSGDDEDDGQAPGIMLKPVGAGGSSRPGTTPAYLQEIIERLNSLFGDAAPLSDKISFVNQIASITRASDVVMARSTKTPRSKP